MAKEATTIYIDDSAIWVLVAKGRQPQKWASMALESGLVKAGVILDEGAVASKVRELWQSQKIGTGRVIAGISGINCLYRLITLPELPKELLPEAIKREAGRVLGVPLEQVYLSWQTIPSLTGETLVYLAASPRNTVDGLISTLRKAGLNPHIMDLKPLALARTNTEPRAIIIDVEPASFDIVIMAERIPQVIRSVPLTQEALLEEKIALIREELNRAITFYNSSHADKPIGADVPLLVGGELAKREDVWKLLVGRQPRPIQTLPVPVETPETFPSSQYITNIGLVLKKVLGSEKGAVAYSLVNFNALPEIYIPKPRPLSQFLLIPTIIVGIAAVVFAFNVNIRAQTHTAALNAELAAINQVVISRRAQANEIAALSKELSSLEATANAFTTTLGSFTAGRDTINSDLSQINKSLSVGGVILENVTHNGNAVTVKGLAAGEDAVFSYARDLRASGRFALVVITEMARQEGGKISFTLAATK